MGLQLPRKARSIPIKFFFLIIFQSWDHFILHLENLFKTF